MACYNKMKRTFLQGLLWMYLLGFGFMALSLEPGFLDFDNLPDTNFTCVGKVIGGYYADLETNCQMFHVCTIGQLDEPMDIRFLCLNGTVFDQETRVCERIDEVDCTKSEQFYSLNLELYGNSQLSNLEENSETEQPLIIKSTPLSTTTPAEAAPRPTSRPAYYTTPTNNGRQQQRLPSHHFPVVDSNTSPDIRFNPEEINISLNPGAPPNIRTNQNRPVSYYSDKKVTGAGQKEKKSEGGNGYRKSEGGGSYQNSDFGGYDRVTPRDVNFGFKFGEGQGEEDEDEEDYGTEETQRDSYHFQTQFEPSQLYETPRHNSSPHQFPSSTYRSTSEFSPSTTTARKNFDNHHQQSSSGTSTTTTLRNYFSFTPTDRRDQYDDRGSPQRIQLPLPTLTFSTPAPFSLQRRIEQKRFTKDLLPPPRIVISASASVSDASGRRLNYSLGTIDTSPLLKHPPATYDEYKDEDVILDPFYADVQKIKANKRRRRRSAQEDKFSHYDVIKNDEDAVRVLKYLFDWYRNEKTNPARFTTPLTSEGISAINDELSSTSGSDELSERSKYSLIEEVEKVNNVRKRVTFEASDDEVFKHEEDYVNDNYEPAAYDHQYGGRKDYDFGSDKGFLHEFVRLNEEAKNFSVPEDYVDDNIEPIYYRDQHNKLFKDYTAIDSSENETNQLEEFSSVGSTTENWELVTTTEYTTDAATTEKTTTTTPRSRRRGRRKYQSETKEKEENRLARLGKLMEKPYRAKDDYDYLRTVHVHTSSPKIATSETRTKNYSDTTTTFLIEAAKESTPGPTESPVGPEESPVALEEATFGSEESPAASTKSSAGPEEPLVAPKEATVELEESSAVFMKSPVGPEESRAATTKLPDGPEESSVAPKEATVGPEEAHVDLEETFVTPTEPPADPTVSPVALTESSVAYPEVTTSELEDKVFYAEVLLTTSTTTTESSRSRSSKRRRGKQKFQDETSQKKSERRRKPLKPQEVEMSSIVRTLVTSEMPIIQAGKNETSKEETFALPAVLEETTKAGLAKNRRGRMKFLTSIESVTEPAEFLRQEEVLGTPNLSSTESLYQPNDSVPNESFPQATSTPIHENSTYAYLKHLEEVYATAFVPTVASKHITKKKQLKENLLNSEFPTTESSLEPNTRRITDITEDYTQSTVVTQITEGEGFVETTTMDRDHVFSEGMNLVSIVVEEKLPAVPDDSQFSTESVPVTVQQKYDETSTTETTLDLASTETLIANTLTTIAATEPPVVSTEPPVVSTEPPVAPTEPPVAPTEPPVAPTEPPVAPAEAPVAYPDASVVAHTETTTGTDYTQIPTTFEQTTLPPFEATTTELPTTTTQKEKIRTQRRKPSRQKPSGYRHRFVSEQFTRRGKDLTTERNVSKKNEELLTDYPLRKSVNPTQAERASVTTPFSKVAVTVRKHLFFNCFGKEVDKFYPDSRDCRLFHYCTRGYNENQLIDMKFVCDFNTFFDDERLICTKTKPRRCL